jgi:hypothetical protein
MQVTLAADALLRGLLRGLRSANQGWAGCIQVINRLRR